MTTPCILRVHPQAGVEGGRVTILGEGMSGDELGHPSPRFDRTETRPLIASPRKIVAPIPEGATSGAISVVWPDVVVEGPFFEGLPGSLRA